MTLTAYEVNSRASKAMNQLRDGHPVDAEATFSSIIQDGYQNKDIWLGLALAHKAQNKPGPMIDALNEVLTEDPTNLRALIMKGDETWELGDHSAAAALYNYIRKLVPDVQRLPSAARPGVERVFDRLKQHSDNLQKHVATESNAAKSQTSERDQARFDHARDLLFARRQRFVQEPRAFFYPELPDRQFYETAEFDWASKLIEAEAAIHEEFETLRQSPNLFTPYIHATGNTPIDRNHPLLDNPDWSAVHLVKNGVANDDITAMMPSVLRALEGAPLERVEGRGPTVLVSRLAAGAKIAPHTGYLNTRLTCHLPIILPGDCGLRVGNETRHWQSGEMLIFNDSINHEAWNNSGQDRYVLIFFVWRPELSEQEREMIKELLESVDAYQPN